MVAVVADVGQGGEAPASVPLADWVCDAVQLAVQTVVRAWLGEPLASRAAAPREGRPYELKRIGLLILEASTLTYCLPNCVFRSHFSAEVGGG
jgi:hypothetical protein